MPGLLVRFASVGIRPLASSRLLPGERTELLRGLARAAPRWGRSGLWRFVGLATSASLGLLIGTLAAIPVYRWNYFSIWDLPLEHPSELLEDFPGHIAAYVGALALHGVAILLLGFVAWLVWLRLGVLSMLRRRSKCTWCQHDLLGLNVSVADRRVTCPECGKATQAIASWNELADSPERPEKTFRPALGDTLAPRVFTRKRVVVIAKLAGAASLCITLGFGAWWGYGWLDAKRQANEARASRLTVEQANARLRITPTDPSTQVGEHRLTIITNIADRASMLTAAYNERNGLTGFEGDRQEVYPDTLTNSLHRTDRPSDATLQHTRALVRELQDAGLERELDRLVLAAKPPAKVFSPVSYDPTDTPISSASRIRQCLRLNLSLLVSAVLEGDLAAFSRRVDTARVLYEETTAPPMYLLDVMLAESALSKIARELEWVARTRANAEWLDVVDRGLASLSRPPLDRALENERVFGLDMLAMHFSDPARVRRGLKDPTIADDPARGLVSSLLGSSESETTPERLGSYQENVAAYNAAFDSAIAIGEQEPWKASQRAVRADSDLYFVRSLGMLGTIRTRHDTMTLMLRSTRVAVRLERFRAEHGRLPTAEEFAAHFAASPDAIDPWSGKLFGYRTTELPKLPEDWPDRGYILWTVGVDGEDNNGAMHRNRDLPLRKLTPGFDALLPDAAVR